MTTALTTRQLIRTDMAVDCPHRSTIGGHLATVTAVETTGKFARVYLDCGHTVYLADGHGLEVVELAADQVLGKPQTDR